MYNFFITASVYKVNISRIVYIVNTIYKILRITFIGFSVADVSQVCYTVNNIYSESITNDIDYKCPQGQAIGERFGMTMNTSESAENYLETILILSKSKPVVRSVDIAEELGFKKSSVSVAMKNLREKNHITVTKEGFIYLTESGKEIAEMIYERHELLSEWLTRLGVDPKVATQDACRIEHVISKESFEAIKQHIK